MNSFKPITWLFAVLLGVIIIYSFSAPSVNNKTIDEEIKLWEKQLNELNYLVIRISATNLVNGLNLSDAQLKQLSPLQKSIDSIYVFPVNENKDLVPEITRIRKTYITLLEYLIRKEKVPEALKNEVFEVRLLHSLLIKKTLHGKSKVKKTKDGCIQCHALPRHFPKNDISLIKNKKVYAFRRYKIDKTHAIGMLGKDVNLSIWHAKDNVDYILNNAQKSVVKSFSCCLLPPGELSDPMRSGQAFSADEWLQYFRDIRKYDKKSWRTYKHLYIKPLENIIIATLPSITEYQKTLSLQKMENILNDIRKMDDITFELQKDNLINRFEACYNFDDITGVTKRSKKIEMYVTSMYLLFPGNAALYEELLKNQ